MPSWNFFAAAVFAPAIFLSGPSIFGQQAQQNPSERASSQFVISFAAVTNSGAVVPDLRADEVTVRIDGRSRQIRSLHVVSIAASSDRATVALPQPFASNTVSARGRDIHLVVDDESFVAGGEQVLRAAAERLLSGAAPSDRIALFAIPHGGVNVGLTTDRTRI